MICRVIMGNVAGAFHIRGRVGKCRFLVLRTDRCRMRTEQLMRTHKISEDIQWATNREKKWKQTSYIASVASSYTFHFLSQIVDLASKEFASRLGT